MICPCCGQPWTKNLAAILATIPFGPREVEIADHFASKFGQFIPSVMTNDFYCRRRKDGGPLDSGKTVKVLVFHMNKKLEPHKLRIRGVPYVGRRMEWIE